MGSKTVGYVMMGVGTVLMFTPLAPFGYALVLGGGLLLADVAKREMKEALNSTKGELAGLQGNTRSSQTPIIVAYGRQRIGANYLYAVTTGQNNKTFMAVLGICEGEIDGIEEILFDGKLVWRNGAALDGPYKPTFVFDFRLGTVNQTSFAVTQPDLVAADPDFTDCFRRTAVAFFKIDFDPTVYQAIPAITFLVRGIKVFDPRNGTTAWSQSGPLQWRDLMTNSRYGAATPAGKIDDAAVGDAATYCGGTTARGSDLNVTGEVVGVGNGVLGDANNGHNSDINYTPHDMVISGISGVSPISPGTLYSYRGVGWGPDSGYGTIITWRGANLQEGHGTIDYTTGAIHWERDYFHSENGTTNPRFGYVKGLRTFGYTLNNTPIQYGTLTVRAVCRVLKPYINGWDLITPFEGWSQGASGFYTLATETFTDNSDGTLTGSRGGTGTVNYATGEILVTFQTAVVDGESITADYTQGSAASLVRYSSSFFATAGKPALDVLRDLCAHFFGSVVFSDGKYKLKIEKPDAYVMAFKSGTEDGSDNIIDGTFGWQMGGMKDVPYRLRIKWIDPAQSFQVVDYLVDMAPALNGRSELTLELLGITNLNTVEKIALTHANTASRTTQAAFSTFLGALFLEPLDIVRVTHPAIGWVDKEMRVVGIEVSPERGDVQLQLKEYDPADYVYQPQATSIVIPPHPRIPRPMSAAGGMAPQVGDLALSEFYRVQKDGTWGTYVRTSFTLPVEYTYLDAVEISASNPTDGLGLVKIGETQTNSFEFGPVREGDAIMVQAIVRSLDGVRWFEISPTATITPVGKTALPTGPAFDSGRCAFTDQCYVFWNPVADADLGNYELRSDLNWGVLAGRLYLGKGTSFTHNPLIGGGGSPQAFNLKTIDTSGNYSATYATITLTNAAPTGAAAAVDWTGRDCLVRWSTSPDVDFLEWEIRVFSDAGRTVQKRATILQANVFAYTYDLIKADFGGAGDPGTIYFRILTRDRYGSTTTTDFSATQATPAILQYDGAGVERVRIGALGGGAYGARFQDANGNTTFEQGDTLKQRFMKIDSVNSIRTLALIDLFTAQAINVSPAGAVIQATYKYTPSGTDIFTGTRAICWVPKFGGNVRLAELYSDMSVRTSIRDITTGVIATDAIVGPYGVSYTTGLYVACVVNYSAIYLGGWATGGSAITPTMAWNGLSIVKLLYISATATSQTVVWLGDGGTIYYAINGTGAVAPTAVVTLSGGGLTSASALRLADSSWLFIGVDGAGNVFYNHTTSGAITAIGATGTLSGLHWPETIGDVSQISASLCGKNLHLFGMRWGYRYGVHHAMFDVTSFPPVKRLDWYHRGYGSAIGLIGANSQDLFSGDEMMFPIMTATGYGSLRSYAANTLSNKTLEEMANAISQ